MEWSFKPGDEVVCPDNPLLYGIMLVVEVDPNTEVKPKPGYGRQHGIHVRRSPRWVACLINPNAWHRRTERFYAGIDELMLAEEFYALEMAA